MKFRISGLCVLALIGVVAGIVFAGKGGGKPGDGDPVYTVCYMRSGYEGPLYVMTEDGSTTMPVGGVNVWSATWHADGDRLLVVSDDYADGPGAYELDLSGNETKLFDLGPYNLSLMDLSMSRVASPSGQRLIAYPEYDDSVSAMGLWVRNEDGSNPVEILAAESEVNLMEPVFHPSGESIAVARKVVGVPGQVWLLELDFDSSGDAFVSNMSPLTGLTGTALEGVWTRFPAFTNSGDTLAVSANSNGIVGIWFVNMADLTDITEVVANGDL
ncbi:MAG: TolB-like translocation protein, partial [Planctomycetota bacterium]